MGIPSDAGSTLSTSWIVASAGTTDPGVAGRVNQDIFFLWESPDNSTVIAAVFDGHGREMGRVSVLFFGIKGEAATGRYHVLCDLFFSLMKGWPV